MKAFTTLLTVICLFFIINCKKDVPVDHMYLHVTFNGQSYGNTFGGIDGYNIWTSGSDSLFGINTLWGPVAATSPSLTVWPNFQVVIQKNESLLSNLDLTQKFSNIVQSGNSYNFLASDTAITTGVMITLYDTAALKNWTSYGGDNTGSTFTITSSGSNPREVTSGTNFELPSTFGAQFSCKLYDDSGNVKLLQGSFSQVGY